MFEPGSVILDRYEVLSVLGEGGYGVVYLAQQLSTGRTVALKLLSQARLERARDPAREMARFEREMQLIAQLQHPNIVRLVDSGRLETGELFTVLTYVDGEDLASVLAREGRLQAREAARIMGQVLDALSAAHELGIVHRDLKPQNIMLTSQTVKRSAMVLDFGIAGIDESHRGMDYLTLTQSGQFQGTPAYMAPEQIENKALTPQTDIYAWGLVFIECLTGELAVEGESLAEMLYKQMSPEPIRIPPAIQRSPLGPILARATAKELDARYATAAEALRDLERCDHLPRAFLVPGPAHDPLGTGPPGIPPTDAAPPPTPEPAPLEPSPPPTSSRLPLILGLLLLLVVLAGGAFLLGRASPAPDTPPPARANAPSHPADTTPVAPPKTLPAPIPPPPTDVVTQETAPPDPPSEPEPEPCPEGQVRSVDTQGACCWPGQAWNGTRCVGLPTACPVGLEPHAETQSCSLPECEDGRVRVADSVHCCWPKQAYSTEQGRCVGEPDCPGSLIVKDETCVPKPPPRTRDLMRKSKGIFMTCFNANLPSTMQLKGVKEVVFAVTIQPSGKVSRVRVLPKSQTRLAYAKCMVEKFEDLRFSSFSGKAVTLEHTTRMP